MKKSENPPAGSEFVTGNRCKRSGRYRPVRFMKPTKLVALIMRVMMLGIHKTFPPHQRRGVVWRLVGRKR
jgi:hypothetical protein